MKRASVRGGKDRIMYLSPLRRPVQGLSRDSLLAEVATSDGFCQVTDWLPVRKRTILPRAVGLRGQQADRESIELLTPSGKGAVCSWQLAESD